MTPRQLGESIGNLYCEGIGTLSTLLEAGHEPQVLKGAVEELKARLIEQLVTLGTERQALELDERMAVDRATGFRVTGVDMAAFRAMTEACERYRGTHNELANLLASFNVIHQYAVFELLAAQLPDEAARLGVG